MPHAYVYIDRRLQPEGGYLECGYHGIGAGERARAVRKARTNEGTMRDALHLLRNVPVGCIFFGYGGQTAISTDYGFLGISRLRFTT